MCREGCKNAEEVTYLCLVSLLMWRKLGLVSGSICSFGLLCSTVRKLSVVFVLNYGTGEQIIKGWLVRLMKCYDVLFFFSY